jgi:hypothetical protein
MLQLGLFPQGPSLAPTPMMNARHLKVEASGHFQHRHLGNVGVVLVAENFGQKNNVVENLAGEIVGSYFGHRVLPSKNQKALHRKPMSAFAQPRHRCLAEVNAQSMCHDRAQEIAAISVRVGWVESAGAYMEVTACLKRRQDDDGIC